MTNRALVMPDYVAELAKLCLAQLGLVPSDEHKDIITASLHYEDGTELSVIVMCLAQRSWFREKPTVAVSIAKLDASMRATEIHLQEVMPVPYGPSDLQFLLALNTNIRAMAWAVAAVGGMGECVELPRPSR
ncbi:hypothetical protein [Mesorhizobium sp.]|uniref:hypothetical protein n=1 Tax=Mesorhizobium sp. TaxID=1871066 RepID=UPI000FE7EB86|nr:hypothetical protein [Mesorhizobium sp.]RWK60688.1 MAG: hypothetical protein EOR49_19865 [Mesorhizobium sp.]RWM46061.1 MAG: hypothetical protein EOR76_19800 [Mesorhizobium sp.]RWM52322.1 MAG: hypothetical protein EOR78_21740 [Mesorhizobium sp.]RWM56655.1 MAG: hypothetical protein EOR79_17995 [Mesorhizobium sp.]RWN00284.1 MAG: hypothetical protein EOR85_17255 [Mesorhizobium sp.]